MARPASPDISERKDEDDAAFAAFLSGSADAPSAGAGASPHARPTVAAPSPGVGAKICVVCGTDASKIKRVKDRSGRYYCAPCYVNRATQLGLLVRFPDQATAPAPAPTPMPAPQPASIPISGAAAPSSAPPSPGAGVTPVFVALPVPPHVGAGPAGDAMHGRYGSTHEAPPPGSAATMEARARPTTSLPAPGSLQPLSLAPRSRVSDDLVVAYLKAAEPPPRAETSADAEPATAAGRQHEAASPAAPASRLRPLPPFVPRHLRAPTPGVDASADTRPADSVEQRWSVFGDDLKDAEQDISASQRPAPAASAGDVPADDDAPPPPPPVDADSGVDASETPAIELVDAQERAALRDSIDEADSAGVSAATDPPRLADADQSGNGGDSGAGEQNADAISSLDALDALTPIELLSPIDDDEVAPTPVEVDGSQPEVEPTGEAGAAADVADEMPIAAAEKAVQASTVPAETVALVDTTSAETSDAADQFAPDAGPTTPAAAANAADRIESTQNVTATTDWTSDPEAVLAVRDEAANDFGPAASSEPSTDVGGVVHDSAPAAATRDVVRDGEAAPSDAAPSDAAPSDAAPSDAAPSDAAPSGTLPSDADGFEGGPSGPAPSDLAPPELAPPGDARIDTASLRAAAGAALGRGGEMSPLARPVSLLGPEEQGLSLYAAALAAPPPSLARVADTSVASAPVRTDTAAESVRSASAPISPRSEWSEPEPAGPVAAPDEPDVFAPLLADDGRALSPGSSETEAAATTRTGPSPEAPMAEPEAASAPTVTPASIVDEAATDASRSADAGDAPDASDRPDAEIASGGGDHAESPRIDRFASIEAALAESGRPPRSRAAAAAARDVIDAEVLELRPARGPSDDVEPLGAIAPVDPEPLGSASVEATEVETPSYRATPTDAPPTEPLTVDALLMDAPTQNDSAAVELLPPGDLVEHARFPEELIAPLDGAAPMLASAADDPILLVSPADDGADTRTGIGEVPRSADDASPSPTIPIAPAAVTAAEVDAKIIQPPPLPETDLPPSAEQPAAREATAATLAATESAVAPEPPPSTPSVAEASALAPAPAPRPALDRLSTRSRPSARASKTTSRRKKPTSGRGSPPTVGEPAYVAVPAPDAPPPRSDDAPEPGAEPRAALDISEVAARDLDVAVADESVVAAAPSSSEPSLHRTPWSRIGDDASPGVPPGTVHSKPTANEPARALGAPATPSMTPDAAPRSAAGSAESAGKANSGSPATTATSPGVAVDAGGASTPIEPERATLTATRAPAAPRQHAQRVAPDAAATHRRTDEASHASTERRVAALQALSASDVGATPLESRAASNSDSEDDLVVMDPVAADVTNEVDDDPRERALADDTIGRAFLLASAVPSSRRRVPRLVTAATIILLALLAGGGAGAAAYFTLHRGAAPPSSSNGNTSTPRR